MIHTAHTAPFLYTALLIHHQKHLCSFLCVLYFSGLAHNSSCISIFPLTAFSTPAVQRVPRLYLNHPFFLDLRVALCRFLYIYLLNSPSSSSSSSVVSLFSSWQQMLQRDSTLESQRRRLSHEWQGGECLISRVTGWLRSWSFRAGTSRVKSRSKSTPLA